MLDGFCADFSGVVLRLVGRSRSHCVKKFGWEGRANGTCLVDGTRRRSTNKFTGSRCGYVVDIYFLPAEVHP
jgi:hypothetical protein